MQPNHVVDHIGVELATVEGGSEAAEIGGLRVLTP
jgi:hypothetical protein